MQEDAHRLLPFFCASVGNNDKNKDCGMIVHCRAAALVAARKRTIKDYSHAMNKYFSFSGGHKGEAAEKVFNSYNL